MLAELAAMNSPRILFCLFGKPDPTYGAGKVYDVISKGLKDFGWQFEFGLLDEGIPGNKHTRLNTVKRCEILRSHILRRQNDFDVIEYDIHHLPFPRKQFSPKCLLVSRSVLFSPHRQRIQWPEQLRLPTRIKRALLGWRTFGKQFAEFEACCSTLRNADLINVTCPEDVAEAQRLGIPQGRILQLPYALTNEELDCLKRTPPAGPGCSRILFLGTFDWRKGAADMPKIFQRILETVPDASLRLAGTQGLFRAEQAVRSFFPKAVQHKLEVILRFSRQELPSVLSDCSAGIFPSYLESWGLSVSEQMAAGIPVVAYDAPGASMQLPRNFLVEAGNWRGMADKLATMLKNPELLAKARDMQKQIACDFLWEPIIKATDCAYRERLLQLKRS